MKKKIIIIEQRAHINVFVKSILADLKMQLSIDNVDTISRTWATNVSILIVLVCLAAILVYLLC